MALTTTNANMVLADRGNAKRQSLGIPAGPDGDDPGLLVLESSSSAKAHSQVFLWADSSNNLRFASTLPTNEDSDGSVLGITVGGGANGTLSNLSSPTAVSQSLTPSGDLTLDLGTAAAEWRYGYIGKILLNSTCYFEGTTSAGLMTMTGALSIAHTNAGNGALITGTSTTGTQLSLIGPASQTTSVLKVNSAAPTWVGASNVGMVHVASSGTLANANASLLYIAHSGAAITSGLGGSLRINDTSTAATGAFVAYITSTTNSLLALVGATTTTKNQLTITGPASQTSSYINITGTFLGASAIGLIHSTNSGNLAHTGATNLYVAQTGTIQASTTGAVATFIDTSANSGTSYAVRIASTNNRALNCSAGQSLFADGLSTKCAVTNVNDTTPTAAELITAFGAANTHSAGFIGTVDDANGGVNFYIVCSDASSYFFLKMTKAT